VAYRSWLKDVKRLDDLAKFMHFFPSSHRDWDREWDLEKKMHEHNMSTPIPVDPDVQNYFQGYLHDGNVNSVERERDIISITIGNTFLDMFVRDFYSEVGEEQEVGSSPVRLVFEGVNYANGVRPDPEGWLKWDKWDSWNSECGTFLRCWFHEQESKVQWVGHFSRFGKGKTKQAGDLFILIDCDRITAKPESERVLRKRLGDECYEAFLFIQSLPKEEQWLWIGHLKRYLDENGIPRRVIPNQSER
jgi:hypothetical protein